jgi:hypothetical protein
MLLGGMKWLTMLMDKQALRAKEFEAIVDTYTQPGAVQGVLPGIERGVGLDKWPSPIHRVNWPLSLTRLLSCGERLILFSCQVGQIDWRNIFPILSVFRW